METRQANKNLWIGFGSLLWIQGQNAFNDNLVKMLLIALAPQVAMGTVLGEHMGRIVPILLLLPFILFAPLAGWLADRYSKKYVLLVCAIGQFSILGFITFSLWVEQLTLAVMGFFLLSIQSAFFNPAKQGIVKELVGSQRLGMATGWMQMVTMLTILGGISVGGSWFDTLYAKRGEKWEAAFEPACFFTVAALVACFLVFLLKRTPSQTKEPFSPKLFCKHFGHLGDLYRNRRLFLAALGIAYFWFVAGFVGILLVDVGIALYPQGSGAATETSKITVIIGVGVALGSLFASFFNRKRIELGIVPLAGGGFILGLGWAGFSELGTVPFYLSLAFIGLSGGIFIVPLNAFLQDKADPQRRGRVLSATNLIINIGGIAAAILQWGLKGMGLSISQQFLLLCLPSLAAVLFMLKLLPQNVVLFLVLSLLRFFYRIKALHRENIPREGGALLVSNHVSYLDHFFIAAACPRPVRFVAYAALFKVWWLGWFLRLFNAVPISKTRAKEALKITVEAIQEGDLVCIFPEGQLTRTGMMNEVKRGVELIAGKAQAPVLPVYLDSVWGSIFSFERDKFFFKFPKKIPYRVTVNFGELIVNEEASRQKIREELMHLGREAFAERAVMQEDLSVALSSALKKKPWKKGIVNLFHKKRRALSRATILSTNFALAKKWREEIADTRVGVLLPASPPASLIYCGLLFAGKTPVVLPFEIYGEEEKLGDVLEREEIRTVISSSSFREVLGKYPWPVHFLDMQEMMQSISTASLLWGWLRAYVEPHLLMKKRLSSHAQGNDGKKIGGIRFLKREKKFVYVNNTHQEILANAYQIADANLFSFTEELLVGIPLEKPAGLQFSLFFPFLHGIPVAYFPLKVDSQEMKEFIVTKRIKQLVGVEALGELLLHSQDSYGKAFLVLLGQEMDFSLQEKLQEKGMPTYCGYAPEESNLVLSLNVPNPEVPTSTAKPQEGIRLGSYGRLLPGFSLSREREERLSRRAWIVKTPFSLKKEKSESNISIPESAFFDEEGFLYMEEKEHLSQKEKRA